MVRLNSKGGMIWEDVEAVMDELEKKFREREVELASEKRLDRTSRQMGGAPHGAVFVWKNESLSYPMALAKQLGRTDLVVVGPSWLNGDGWKGTLVLSGLVLDHELELTARQKRSLSGLLGRARELGETVKIMQTPAVREEGLTPGKALVYVVEQAARVWDRAREALDHWQGKQANAWAAASRCAMQAKESKQEIGAIISAASEAMEECVSAGRASDARAWIDALDEIRRVSEAADVAVRLADGNGGGPYHPQRLDFMWKAEERARRVANLRDGEPCGHPGCLAHVSHPCEGCGRMAGRRVVSDDAE